MTAKPIWTCLSFLSCGIALATLALAQPPTVDLGDQRPIDICEIVRHAERYQGRVVAVSGFYDSGPHGATIANEHCGFRNRYRAFGRGAAAAVEYDLSAANSKYNLGEADRESIRRFRDARSKALSAGGSTEIATRVTVLGMISVAEHFSLRDYGDRGSEGTGFGQMGVYPVQVAVLAVKTFSITVPKASRKRGS